MGNSTACGQDHLDSLSLKCATMLLAPHINHLINSSISSKVYIMKWKTSVIIPILKSKESSPLQPASYRPISLLPVLSKLVEHAVQQQLQQHLEIHQLLHPNVHAYHPNKSTTTAIMQITDNLYQATDNNMMSSLLALDQSAAFDCVSHRILLQKLELYNCSQDTLTWMESYLKNRTQAVKIGKHTSRLQAVDRGVPQGSILGPLLSIVYTNELPETIINYNCHQPGLHHDTTQLFGNTCKSCGQLVSYADDITLVLSDRLRVRNQLKLNLNLACLESFLHNNELAVNVSKTAIQELMIKQKKGRTKGDPPHLMVMDPKHPGQLMKIAETSGDQLSTQYGMAITLGNWQQSHLPCNQKSTRKP